MNTANAWGFLFLGSVMNALPWVAPGIVASSAAPGDLTTAALWLHFMGSFMGSIGMGYVSRAAYRQAPVVLGQLANAGIRVLRPIARPASAQGAGRVPVGARVTAAF
jgi:hypothetical protein